MSTALDDVLGTMAWREVGFPRWGLPTMRLTVRFLAGAPMERQLRFDTRVVKREGRKVHAAIEHVSSSSLRTIRLLRDVKQHMAWCSRTKKAVSGARSDVGSERVRLGVERYVL